MEAHESVRVNSNRILGVVMDPLRCRNPRPGSKFATISTFSTSSSAGITILCRPRLSLCQTRLVAFVKSLAA